MIEKDEFVRFIGEMRGSYPQKYFIPNMSSMDSWYQAFREFNIDELRKAFQTYSNSNENPPSIAALRQLIGLSKPAVSTIRFDWTGLEYWVLLDLDGYFLNDLIVYGMADAMEVQNYFRQAMSLEGTVTKRVDPMTFRKKYRPTKTMDTTLTKDEVKNIFKGITIERT